VGGVVVEDEVHLVLGGDLAVELVDCADGVVRRCAPAPQLTLSWAAHSGRPTTELQIHCYRLGSVQDAEDLSQQTLLAAWRGIGGDEERASVRTWLYRIAANRCLNPLLYRDEGWARRCRRRWGGRDSSTQRDPDGLQLGVLLEGLQPLSRPPEPEVS
jgi:hypothetical protein